MRSTENWKDYELIDASEGERLERWGDIILTAPTPRPFGKRPVSTRDGSRLTAAITEVNRAAENGSFIKKFPRCGA